jgi:putative tricarboxylic transport membrane protein
LVDNELKKAWNSKMIVANRICGLILLVLALVSLWEGMKTWDGMGGTGFMPVIVGIIFALLGLGILSVKQYAEDRQPIRWPSKIGWQRLVLVFSALVAYPLAVPWLGYPVASALFLTGLCRVMGNIGWRRGMIFGLVSSGSTYIIFKIWLHMPLPAGILGI